MIGDEETSEECGHRFIKQLVLLEVAVTFKNIKEHSGLAKRDYPPQDYGPRQLLSRSQRLLYSCRALLLAA